MLPLQQLLLQPQQPPLMLLPLVLLLTLPSYRSVLPEPPLSRPWSLSELRPLFLPRRSWLSLLQKPSKLGAQLLLLLLTLLVHHPDLFVHLSPLPLLQLLALLLLPLPLLDPSMRVPQALLRPLHEPWPLASFLRTLHLVLLP